MNSSEDLSVMVSTPTLYVEGRVYDCRRTFFFFFFFFFFLFFILRFIMIIAIIVNIVYSVPTF